MTDLTTLPDSALIARVRELAADATPGPWETEYPFSSAGTAKYYDVDGPVAGVAEYVEGPDAALIAAYRTAAPELADRLERAMAEVERLRRSLTNLAIIHERRGA